MLRYIYYIARIESLEDGTLIEYKGTQQMIMDLLRIGLRHIDDHGGGGGGDGQKSTMVAG